MKIIIPMAGMGKRMRPQTLTTPKPLIPISGKSIVQRLIEELVKSVNTKVDEISFIIGEFGVEVEKMLKDIAKNLGIKSKIYYQNEALGTAHAIYCAKDSLDDSVIVAFADTLFKSNFKFNKEEDGIIWVKKVENPKEFGVVKLDENDYIVDFIEKPDEYISDLAIIGIYYFKDGNNLKDEIKYIIDKKILVGKEYQLTTVLENMKNKGKKFAKGEVDLWLDCGNKIATINTNTEILKSLPDWEKRENNFIIKNSVIIEPCYIGENVEIYDSVIGPNVSVENGTKIKNSIIKDSIIQSKCKIKNICFSNSMIGNSVEILEKINEFNFGDFTRIEND